MRKHVTIVGAGMTGGAIAQQVAARGKELGLGETEVWHILKHYGKDVTDVAADIDVLDRHVTDADAAYAASVEGQAPAEERNVQAAEEAAAGEQPPLQEPDLPF